MKHTAQINSEFVKEARSWEDLSLEEQKGYLSRHPKSKRRLTSQKSKKLPQKSIDSELFNKALKDGENYAQAAMEELGEGEDASDYVGDNLAGNYPNEIVDKVIAQIKQDQGW